MLKRNVTYLLFSFATAVSIAPSYSSRELETTRYMSRIAEQSSRANSTMNALALDIDNNNNAPRESRYFPWENRPLVTAVVDGTHSTHPTMMQLTRDFSLATDLSNAISKRYACTHFLAQNQGDQGALTQNRDEQTLLALNIFRRLLNNGWEAAVPNEAAHADDIMSLLKNSIIEGKAGAGLNMVDNHPGVVLFHRETGTLLSAFHGSRGDSYLPHSHDWDANLDTEIHDWDHHKAHRGFSMSAHHMQDSLQGIILSAYASRQQNQNNVQRIMFTGHSYGAAVSSQACIKAIDGLGKDLFGANFNNATSNRFGHFGMSEPASVCAGSVEAVRAKYGKGAFLSMGVSQDPVMQFFRAEFWRDVNKVMDITHLTDETKQQIYPVLTMVAKAAGVMSSRVEDWLNAGIKLSQTEGYSHVGYLATEPIYAAMERLAITGVGKTIDGWRGIKENKYGAPKDVLSTFISAIHYGGEGMLFDSELPGALGGELDKMLDTTHREPMTIARFIEDLKALKSKDWIANLATVSTVEAALKFADTSANALNHRSGEEKGAIQKNNNSGGFLSDLLTFGLLMMENSRNNEIKTASEELSRLTAAAENNPDDARLAKNVAEKERELKSLILKKKNHGGSK